MRRQKQKHLPDIIRKTLITGTKAIVLNHLRYGDSSLIAHLYTENMGRQTVFVKGAYGKKSPMRAVLFQPLHLIETDVHHRENRQMQRISHARLFCPFRNIPFDPVKTCIALFIAEILHKTLKEEEANRQLFDFLTQAVQTLDLNDNGTANFHLMFLIHYTRYLGFYPDIRQSSDGMWFDSRKGGFGVMPDASSPLPEYNQLLIQLFRMSFEHLNDLQISHRQRNYLTEYLLGYYSMHVENFGKVKSYSVLQNVFRD